MHRPGRRRACAPGNLDIDVFVNITRFSEQDRADIELLAREGLIDARLLRRRAEETLQGYVGALDSVRTSIALACRIAEAAAQPRRKR